MTVEVLVKSKETGEERTISYKSYLDTSYLFNLIGEWNPVTKQLVPGDPNLQARHRKVPAMQTESVNVADHADDVKEDGEDLEPAIHVFPEPVEQSTKTKKSSKHKTIKA